MRAPIFLIALTVAAATSPTAYAQSTQSAPDAQQESMKTCNTQASSLKLTGHARKNFMSDCLSGNTTSGSGISTENAQRGKMRYCNLSTRRNGTVSGCRT